MAKLLLTQQKRGNFLVGMTIDNSLSSIRKSLEMHRQAADQGASS